MTVYCLGCEVVRIKDLIRNAVWSAGAFGLVVGVSGGIDSAVVLALCAKSVGAENVIAVNMPVSTNNPKDTADAELVCKQYGVKMISSPLGKVLDEFKLVENFSDERILTGNTAARLRMAMLYNIAGAKHYLVCGTSNKTEYMIGYSTKWGDSAADIQPIVHLLKRDVYALAKELEISEEIIDKVPSAGFFEGQTDEEDIGVSYDDLDKALISLEENDWEAKTEIEKKVLAMVEKSRHKRVPAANLIKAD
ncbi:MAG: NAD(+) synthase [Methanocorpusculum sp.]|nr:NAD(+) synthase [Methanocorpusculum sp.]